MILRVLHYNPLSANQLRLEEILRATQNFSIVGLVATQRMAPVGLEVGSSKQFGCAIVEAGWARAPLSNKSAGSTHRAAQTLHFGTHKSDTDTTTIIARSSTGGTSQRRVFSICLSVACICMYLPPKPQTASKRGGYQRTVERVLEWLDGCLSEQRHRTTLVVLMAANDGIGLELRAGRYRPVPLSVHCSCRSTSRTRGGQASMRDHGQTPHEGHFGGNGRRDVV